MRLWHYKLIPFLPDSQLVAQWRELNSIFKNQPKYILINYVYEYPKDDLYFYSQLVIDEMKKRNFKIKSFDNFYNYFNGFTPEKHLRFLFDDHHGDRYFLQCYYNLQEKFDRGQKDFSEKQYDDLVMFVTMKSLLRIY